MTKRKPLFKPGWGLALLAAAVVIAGVIWLYRAPIQGYAAAGTAYSARVACSCRFVAGRSLDDCAKDKLAGMELVRLSENEETRRVTASFPLVRSDTASYREGYGCVLQDWQN